MSVSSLSGTIEDLSSNPCTSINGTLGSVVVDTTITTVSNVTSSTTNGSYIAGNTISIQVVFSKTVIVTGTPQLTLETGTNDADVNYASGSGSNTLTFTYTVASGHTSSDLDYKATNSLSLNGGTIKDVAGNSAALTLPSPNATGSLRANKAIVVDTTATSIVSFIISNTSLKVGETATVTLQFSESVSGFNSDDDISVQNGSLATMTSSDNITWTGTFTPTDDIEDNSNILQLASSYTDSAGNSGPTAQTANYSIDTKEPTVVSFTISDTSLKVGETATVTLQFSESVSGFNSDADITEQNGSLATMTSSDNITWTGTFTPTDDIEDTTNILQLASSYTDSAGNSGPTAQTANYSIDTKEPTITNYNPSHTGTLSSNSDNIILTFNENVTAGTGNIVLKQGGSTISTSFSCSGTTCTINPSSDLSNLGLTYNVEIDSTAIKDTAGNYFAGFSGTTYQINSKLVDTTAPYMISWSPWSSSNSYSSLATSSDTVTLTFTTNETIKTPNISINGQTPSISNTSGNTWTATYSPQALHNVGPMVYSLTYEDLAGNSGSSSYTNSSTGIAHYETNDLRHYMWKQNLQSGSEPRGSVGYTYLRGILHWQSSLCYGFSEALAWGGNDIYAGIPGVSTIVWEPSGMNGHNDNPPHRNTSVAKPYIYKIVFDQRNVSGGTDYRTYVDTPLANVNYRIFSTYFSLNTSSTTVQTSGAHEVGTQHPWFDVSSNYVTQKRRTFTNTQKLKITRSTKSAGSTFGGYWNINLHDSIGHNNSSQIYKVSLITLSSFNNSNKYGYILTDTPVGHAHYYYSTHSAAGYFGSTHSYDDDFDLLTGQGGNFY